jgi:hypothetical protein
MIRLPQFSRVFLSIWLVYIFHFRHLAAGSDRFVLLTMAIVERGTIQLDAYYNNPFYQPYLGDILLYNNHAYININAGLSFLAVPAWSLIYFFYKFIPETSLIRQEAIHYFLAHFVTFSLTTALLSALTAWLLALIVQQKSKQQWRSICAALLYAFGSISFYLSTRLNQNIPIAFILVLSFIYLFIPHLLAPKSPKFRAFILGILLGIGMAIDTTMMPGLGVVGLFLIWQYRHALGTLLLAIAGVILPIIGQLTYHFIAFGNFFLSPSLVLMQQNTGVDSLNPASMGLNLFNFANIPQYLFGVKAGLFIYMPFSLLAVYYFAHFARQQTRLKRLEKLFLFALFGSYILFLLVLPSSYLYPLFGPRYLFPIVPFLSLLLALYWRSRDLQLGLVLIALSLLFNLAGAQLGNDTNNIFVTTAIYILRGPWLPIVDWLRVELPQTTAFELTFLSPYGLLLMLAGCLGLLWLGVWITARYGDRGEYCSANQVSSSSTAGDSDE